MTIATTTHGHGKDVVLLHGCGDDQRYLAPIAEALRDYYRVTILDQPGCGKTPWPANIHTIHDLADSLLPVLPAKAIYIGSSMGGLLALSIAARYPERVERMINVTSSPKFVEDDNWPGIAKPGVRAVLPLVKQSGFNAFLDMFFEDEFAEFNPKPNNYQTIKHLIANGEKTDLHAITERMRLVDTTDLRAELSALTCPIDFIMGRKDATVPTDAYDKIQQLNPRINIHVLEQAKHMPHWTHPKEFNNLLQHILRGK